MALQYRRLLLIAVFTIVLLGTAGCLDTDKEVTRREVSCRQGACRYYCFNRATMLGAGICRDNDKDITCDQNNICPSSCSDICDTIK
ncbi:hypothetical protein C0J52_26525 [Blattella germanica]|nr:hypothetical protein C0J52_26525 [Blattella germanica]